MSTTVDCDLSYTYLPTVDEWMCNCTFYHDNQIVDEYTWYHKRRSVCFFMASVRWSRLALVYGLPEDTVASFSSMANDGNVYTQISMFE